VRIKDRDAFARALPRLSKGTVLVLEPGHYGGDYHVAGKKGFTIRARDPKKPPRFGGGRQALHFAACVDFTLENLVVENCSINGINIDDGGKRDTPTTGIRIRGVTVESIGPRGNHDGLKLSGIDDFTVSRCSFGGWGGSAIDMVGCHDGTIEDCRFVGREGYSQSNAVQAKGGTKSVTIRRSFFKDPGHRGVNIGGGTGLDYFRPKDAKWEAENVTVTECRFTGGDAAVAFVNSKGCRVERNTIHLPKRWVLRILQETRGERFPACREGIFARNLIVTDRRLRSDVNVGPGTEPKTFRFERNLWFRVDGGPSPRLPVAEKESLPRIDPKLVDAGTERMRAGSKDARLKGIGAPGPARLSKPRAK
jgi:hypothetical protein